MLLRTHQNIMLGALYTTFVYYWFIQMFYYGKWGFYLRQLDRVTGPVQADPLGTGVADVDPFQKERWNNRVFRTTYIIAFANNIALSALALEYSPRVFAVVAEWVWAGFAILFLTVTPLETCPILAKLADIGMLSMNVSLGVAGLIGLSHHTI